MAVERVGDMTVQELESFVLRVVDRRVKEIRKPLDPKRVQEILDSIDRHMWTPPPGSPSTLELLREDRDA